MTSAFIPNHMIRVSVVAVGTTLHTNPGIRSIGIPQPVGIRPTGVWGLGTRAASASTSRYSPHGRVGAGITCTPGTAISGFAPRACGGWDAGGGRRASGRIRPTGVWGLGALLPPIPVGVDSPHGRVGAGTTRHLIHPTGVRGLGRNTQKHRRIHPTGVRGLGIGCRTPVAAAYSPNGRVGAGNTSSASAKFCGFTPRVCGVYG